MVYIGKTTENGKVTENGGKTETADGRWKGKRGRGRTNDRNGRPDRARRKVKRSKESDVGEG
jgi:hypothetical protein